MNEWMDEWIREQTNEWIDGWMEGWVICQFNKCVHHGNMLIIERSGCREISVYVIFIKVTKSWLSRLLEKVDSKP